MRMAHGDLVAGTVVIVLVAVNAGMAWLRGDAAGLVAAGSVAAVGLWALAELWQRWKRQHEARGRLDELGEAVPRADPATLLHPARQVVPFTGREQLRDQLVAWCREEGAEPVRLVVGAGGSGKSRLALELGRVLGSKWTTLPVRDEALAKVVPGTRELGERLLVVVDYAETRDRAGLEQLLSDVAAADRWVRVLLLARQIGDWWTTLAPASARGRQVVAAADTALIDLGEHPMSGESPEVLVRAAVPYFADALEAAAPAEVVVDTGDRARYRVLDLHAAALVAVLSAPSHPRGSPVTVDLTEVLDSLLGHERRYWIHSLRSHTRLGWVEPYADRVIAAATLLGAGTEDEAVGVLARVSPELAMPEVARWVRGLYPPDDAGQWWEGLRPDRLAEHHIVKVLTGSQESERFATACLADLDDHQALHAYSLLARAAYEHSEAIALLRTHLPALVADETRPVELLDAIYIAHPDLSVGLADISLRLVETVLDRLPPDTPDSEQARHRHNLGICLSELGRYEEALAATEEAVTFRRELARVAPDRFRPYLAGSLDNLGIRLGGLGRYEEALAATEEAVTFYRELARVAPDRFRPNLAGSLSNLGVCLGELGRFEEALAATEEAVALYRELARVAPDRFRPDLARSLSNLGNRLGELGRDEEALTVFEEADAVDRGRSN